MTNGDNLAKTNKPTKNAVYICECGKTYKYRQGLHRHQKQCQYILQENEINDETDEITNEVTLTNNDEPNYKDLLIQSLKENSLMRQEICEIRKDMSNMIPLIGNNNNNTTNNFNLNFFLNEQCKDALNLTDFVNSLQVQLKDLEYTAENGHIKGITNIFHNALNNMEVTKRPLHCTDFKREVLYIKDNDEWHKDENKEEIKVAVNKVVNKNIGNQAKWIEAHPNLNDETEMEKYIKMQDHSLGTGQEIEKNKIIKNIMKEVTILK